jgi:hypothetical protein
MSFIWLKTLLYLLDTERPGPDRRLGILTNKNDEWFILFLFISCFFFRAY